MGFGTIPGSRVEFAFRHRPCVANFSSYASTYGVLGAVLIALGWLHFSSMAFFIGAELDLVLHRKREHG
ncbi:MAG: YhjD/YihY/BrkB family envelope integrity protein [Dehalococcoidia bacterium]|nr:YhjD/YihY/BrkB family envelope integrity protein [Dehalococcoidia bacterium]